MDNLSRAGFWCDFKGMDAIEEGPGRVGAVGVLI